jgi:hypothetical protein
MATTSCNMGTLDVPWFSIYGDAQRSPESECPDDPPAGMSGCHPSIGMKMYRLRDGRLEQIGISWMKHGWFALSSHQCTECLNGDPSGNHLGVGCSDTYGSGNNASRSDLGPRSEWNPHTGHWEPCGSHFDGPNNDCRRSSHTDSGVNHRVRVADADLNDPSAEYFYQGAYYVRDEALLWDNIGWQPIDEVTWDETNSDWDFTLSHPNEPTWGPIIRMWNPSAVKIDTGEGLAYVGSNVTQIDEATWHYEYGVYNFTSNIPITSLSVPVPPNAVITEIGFHDVDDPEEPWDLDDWAVTEGDGLVAWAGETYDTNVNANALRFGRYYSFWFDATVPPQAGQVSLGLFLPGSPEAISANVEVPLLDIAPPKIIAAVPHSGYIDPRMESSDGVHLDLGVTRVELVFSEAIRTIGGTPVTAEAFAIRETGGGEAPEIVGIETEDDLHVTVLLDRPITLQEWTTITAVVEDMAGNSIVDLGDLGPDIDEGDRVDIGFVPGDISQDGDAQPVDLSLWRQMYFNQVPPIQGAVELYIDTDRNGAVQPRDITIYIKLLLGNSPATQRWLGQGMNNPRP